MTDYKKLVRDLRFCPTPYSKLLHDAANAIEALQAELERKRTADCFGCKCEKLEPKRGQYVHGRELSREYIGDCLVSIDYEDWRCSVCGIVFEQWSIPKYNYCPNCGAKMNDTNASNTLNALDNAKDGPIITPCRGCSDYDGYGGFKSKGGCARKKMEVQDGD